MRIRVKFCPSCQRWLCRVLYPGHRCMWDEAAWTRWRWLLETNPPYTQESEAHWHLIRILEAQIEELEWHAIISKPHVQACLARLAEEAERQYARGETEEGGFDGL